jgi:hypothetical protein
MDVDWSTAKSGFSDRKESPTVSKVRGIGGLKVGIIVGEDTVIVKIIEARSSGPYLAHPGINILCIFFFSVLVPIYRQ